MAAYYGKWRSVHKRFEAWSRRGLWDKILEHFTEGYDAESMVIDVTIIRFHPCAAGYEKDQGARECLGRSKGGFTTKIHVIVDALRQAFRFSLTPGQSHDITQASTLLQGFEHANIKLLLHVITSQNEHETCRRRGQARLSPSPPTPPWRFFSNSHID